MKNLKKKARRKNNSQDKKKSITPTCGNEKEVRSERDHLFIFM